MAAVYRGLYVKGPADKPLLGGEIVRGVTRCPASRRPRRHHTAAEATEAARQVLADSRDVAVQITGVTGPGLSWLQDPRIGL